jgi:hypothetical protein
MTRRLIDNSRADLLGVPEAGPVRFLFNLVRVPARAVSPWLQGRLLAPIANNATKRLYQAWIDKYDGERPPWRVPDVAQKWGLRPKPGGTVVLPAEQHVPEPPTPVPPAPSQPTTRTPRAPR